MDEEKAVAVAVAPVVGEPAMNKGRKISLRATEGGPAAGARGRGRSASIRGRKQAEAEGEPRPPRRSERLRRKADLAGATDEELLLYLNLEINHLHNRRALLDGQQEKRKKIKVILEEVSEAAIDQYILNPPYNPEYSEYKLRKRSQEFRERYLILKALAQKLWEYQCALVNQFRTKGYAMNCIAVEEEEEEQDEEQQQPDEELQGDEKKLDDEEEEQQQGDEEENN